MAITDRNVLKILCIVTLLCLPAQLRAEDRMQFIQFECVPDLSYFSVHTISAENLMNGAPKGWDQKMMTPDMFEKKPFTCTFSQPGKGAASAYTVTARATSYSPPDGGCAFPEFGVSIEVDGKSVYRFNPYGTGCGAEETHLVEVDEFNLRDCAIAEHGLAATCTKLQLRSHE